MLDTVGFCAFQCAAGARHSHQGQPVPAQPAGLTASQGWLTKFPQSQKRQKRQKNTGKDKKKSKMHDTVSFW